MPTNAFTLVLLLGSVVLLARPGSAEDACVACHPDAKTASAEGAHAGRLGCTACHGGDPGLRTLEAHATARGYVGTPSRADIPKLCGSCHADPVRMKPSGLPTDQWAQYQTSRHGVRLAAGDTRVAVCTDCHGSHRVLPGSEPTSPVARRNLAATCGRCHADATLMSAYGLPTNQVEAFTRSVHGTALLVDEHPAAPTCAGCHGAHGAAVSQEGTVKVCDRCHARVGEQLRDGPHGQAVRDGRMSECVACHGAHDIARPDPGLFDTACAGCHPRESGPFVTGQKLKTLLVQATDAVDTASNDIARVARLSPTVTRYRARLRQAHAYLMEAAPEQHGLRLDRVEDLTRNARSVADEVRSAVGGVDREWRWRYIVLGLVWLYGAFAVAVGWRRHRQRRREEQR
jgi:hypothetical protein